MSGKLSNKCIRQASGMAFLGHPGPLERYSLVGSVISSFLSHNKSNGLGGWWKREERQVGGPREGCEHAPTPTQQD